MIEIALPDGNIRSYPGSISGLQLATDLSKSLAKAAVAMRVNGELRDLSDEITGNAEVAIVTVKDADGLEIMRHTVAAQLLGRAVKDLYPGAKLAIGPTIANGFYYDVLTSEPISQNDLPRIEQRMLEIQRGGAPIRKEIVDRGAVEQMFADIDEEYKVDIASRAENDGLSVYFQENSEFFDLCRGPHLPNLKMVGAFKLTKLAGAYWRGDSQNEMLTRIYGTAWASQKELDEYLHRMEEAEKRDHRKLAQAMDLFHFQPEAPGQVFWHDKGWTIYRELENYIRGKIQAKGYLEINTPKIINKQLFVDSGHWEKFGTDEMFVCEAYGSLYALKPMNCPCHVQVFNFTPKSYRDLPLKLSEFGNCMRQEPRGSLHGLMRVTSMTQDDAHIFCTIDQIKDQVIEMNGLISDIYKELGFDSYYVRFSDRPEQRVGSDDVWDKAEESLRSAAVEAGLELVLNKGDGAFYGPKLEFVIADAIGREWQCGTIQLDFNLPVRLGALYVDEDGERKHPIMIHRALLGSMERFLGMFLEHHAGNLPLWISPVQVVVTGVSEKHADYAAVVVQALKDAGMRAVLDDRNEKVSFKIRDWILRKASIVCVVGDNEAADETVSVRRLGQEKQTIKPLKDFVNEVSSERRDRKLSTG